MRTGLHHLIQATQWNDVERSLLQLFTDARQSLEGYREVFFQLRRLTPVPNVMRICLRTTYRPGLDERPFLEVVGRDGTLNRDQEDFKYLGETADSLYALSEAEFALELEAWQKWLGMEIDTQTLDEHIPCEIVAHCLQEMTFVAFDKVDIRAQRLEIERRVDELNAMSEKERRNR